MLRGFTLLEGEDFLETFSPVTKLTIVNMILALAAIKGWSLSHLDINNAFLYRDLEEEIYMTLVQGLEVDRLTGEDSQLLCATSRSLYMV